MRMLAIRRSVLSLVMTTQHLTPTQIAAFIDRSMTRADRAEAELHLSGCDRCREELAACAQLAANAPSQSRRHVPWRFVGVAAAAVLIALAVRPTLNRDERGSSRERTSSAETNRITILRPAPDAGVPRSMLDFAWRADERSTGYRVILTNDKGEPVWTADVDSTRITPPDSVILGVGARYFWRVETLHADGSTAQSPTTAFHIVAK
jgi:hypothetical protein